MTMMERFLKYAVIGTNSNPKSDTIPAQRSKRNLPPFWWKI